MTDNLDTAAEELDADDELDVDEEADTETGELDDGLDDDDEGEDEGPDGNRADGGLSGQVLEFLARSIVDDPDSVVVDAERRNKSVSLELNVAPGDMGRVIGRRGRVAQAIRAVVRAAGAKEGVNVQVDIVD